MRGGGGRGRKWRRGRKKGREEARGGVRRGGIGERGRKKGR